MLDLGFIPPSNFGDYQYFGGNSPASLTLGWDVWKKPRGVTMVFMIAVGGGGNGGTAATGAAGSSAGGGGGGTGSVSTLLIPAMFMPQEIFISAGTAGSSGAPKTYISVKPSVGAVPPAADLYLVANAGTNGGAGAGATVGAAGGGGVAVSQSNCLLGLQGFSNFYAGVAGGPGVQVAAATDIFMFAGGIFLTPGGGGSGLPTSGASGGSIIATPANFPFQILTSTFRPIGGTTPTTVPQPGQGGFKFISQNGLAFTGGGGGSSTNAAATGTGLVQAKGGDGAPGCGGGGVGGALTGSTLAVASKGGEGFCMIWGW